MHNRVLDYISMEDRIEYIRTCEEIIRSSHRNHFRLLKVMIAILPVMVASLLAVDSEALRNLYFSVLFMCELALFVLLLFSLHESRKYYRKLSICAGDWSLPTQKEIERGAKTEIPEPN